jgi:regulator of RNase E activity RraB
MRPRRCPSCGATYRIVEADMIDKNVIELQRLAQHSHGEYDGWETTVESKKSSDSD